MVDFYENFLCVEISTGSVIKLWNLADVDTIEVWRGSSLVNCKSNYVCSENGIPPENSSEMPQHCWCLRYGWINTVHFYVNSVIHIFV